MPRPLPSRNLRMVTLRAPLALLVAALLAVTPSNAQDPPNPRIKAGELYAAAQKARNEGDYHRALALYKKTFDVLNMQCSPGTVMLTPRNLRHEPRSPAGQRSHRTHLPSSSHSRGDGLHSDQ